MPKFVPLWTDVAIWLLFAAVIGYIVLVRRRPNLLASWRKVFSDAPALASALVLLAGGLLTLSDSLHFRTVLPAPAGPAGCHPALSRRPACRGRRAGRQRRLRHAYAVRARRDAAAPDRFPRDHLL